MKSRLLIFSFAIVLITLSSMTIQSCIPTSVKTLQTTNHDVKLYKEAEIVYIRDMDIQRKDDRGEWYTTRYYVYLDRLRGQERGFTRYRGPVATMDLPKWEHEDY
jgi:hypothetical protein